MNFYERVSGARMHSAYIRPGGVSKDLPEGLLNSIYLFSTQYNCRINEIEELLTRNRIWRQRLYNIGVVSAKSALSFGFSGVLLRATGINWDLRKNRSYEIYNKLTFRVPTSGKGDSYARYLLRIEELRQSNWIIAQILNEIPSGQIKVENFKLVPPSVKQTKNIMESLIHHFKLYCNGLTIVKSETYVGIEAPKGEFLWRIPELIDY